MLHIGPLTDSFASRIDTNESGHPYTKSEASYDFCAVPDDESSLNVEVQDSETSLSQSTAEGVEKEDFTDHPRPEEADVKQDLSMVGAWAH